MAFNHTITARHWPRAHSREISIMAATPANPGHNGFGRTGASSEHFEAFADQALREHAAGIPGMPTTADIEPRQLVRYAAGRTTADGFSADDRVTIQDFVQRSPWCYDRVVALVKAKRPGQGGLAGAIARRLLDASERPAHQVAALAVLEVEGLGDRFETALEKLGTTGSVDAWLRSAEPSTIRGRAACLVGMGKSADAKKLLENADKNDATANLLRRIASSLSSEDDSLLALLDAFPALMGENGAKKRGR